jgi:putative endopeptidase
VNEEVYQSHMKKQCHPLSRYRVNTPLRNLHEFVEAFNIQPGDEMWLDPDERITIW